MTKESLMQMGLSEDQANQVMEALNGSFVTKARFNEVNSELQTARQTIKDRDGQLEELKKSKGDADALREQITQLQATNAEEKKNHEAELKKLRLENAVELALTNAKAKNHVAAKALLAEFLSKAEPSEDGTVKGLDAEVKKLTEGADTAFLFDTTNPTVKGAKPAEKSDPPAAGGMTLEEFQKLPPLDRHKYSVEHPDEYKKLYGGN